MSEQSVILPGDEWQKSFLFSVIVPVYNTEDYVEETIQSVISQSIGFMDNIQLILVNNATADHAGAICERYQRNYPHNVVYVELPENRGPSGARNAGIPYVRGKYVNFLDSDDKWDKNAFKQVADFLLRHGDEVMVTLCRKRYFDAWDGWFYDDAHYHATRVSSIWSEPERAQFWIGAGFFRTDVFETLRFDEDARFSEDMKFLNEVLLCSEKYGIIREAVFYYRKRKGENLSQVQMQRTGPYWYFDSIDKCFNYVVKVSKQRFGEVIPYVQYVLMQELVWRISQKSFPKEFTEQNFRAYQEKLNVLVQNIDEHVIAAAPIQSYWKEYRLACLCLKYGRDIREELELRKKAFIFHNFDIFHRDEKEIITFLGHKVGENNLILKFQLNIPLEQEQIQVWFQDTEGNQYTLQPLPFSRIDGTMILGKPFGSRYRGVVEFPIPKKDKKLWPMFRFRGIEYGGKIDYAAQSRLSRKLKNACCVDSRVVLVPDETCLHLIAADKHICRTYEKAIRRELLRAHYKRGFAYRMLQSWLRRGEKSWILYLGTTPVQPENELRLRKAAIEAALQTKDEKTKVWLVCPESELRWASQYGTPIQPVGWNWVRIVFSASAALSFNWQETAVFGWHTDLVKDLLTFERIQLNDYVPLEK